MKNHFPFRIGTTSLIFDETILSNISSLKKKVDHIELFTDNEGNLCPQSNRDIAKELITIADDNDLTYSVHLPMGLKLGSPEKRQRKAGIEAILRAVETTHMLQPLAWDLHLEQNYRGQILDEQWQEACVSSLEELKQHGVDPFKVGIETLEFDFEPIIPVLDNTNFAVTLDIGHVWYASLNEKYYLDEILPRAINFHLHGCNKHRDHKGLHFIDEIRLHHFLEALYAHPEVGQLAVCLEVFNPFCLEWSLDILKYIDQKIKTSFPQQYFSGPIH